MLKDKCICGRCSQMCRETLFSWKPLLSLCCGLLVGFIPVQDDIIVQAERENTVERYCRKSIHFTAAPVHKALLLQNSKKGSIFNVAHIALFLFLVCLHFAVTTFCIAKYLGHVTTMLFICLQKLNTAMLPCHPSSAAERGRAWKGKAKARKTQVAGKGHSALCGQKCSFYYHYTALQQALIKPLLHVCLQESAAKSIPPSFFPLWVLFFWLWWKNIQLDFMEHFSLLKINLCHVIDMDCSSPPHLILPHLTSPSATKCWKTDFVAWH